MSAPAPPPVVDLKAFKPPKLGKATTGGKPQGKDALNQAGFDIDPTKSDFPCSWIRSCPLGMHYMNTLVSKKYQNDILVADYGPGWSPEVPFFFLKHFGRFFDQYNTITDTSSTTSTTTNTSDSSADSLSSLNYIKPEMICIDLHEMRMDNLFYKFIDHNIADRVRTMTAKLEDMCEKAYYATVQRMWFKPGLSNSFDTWMLKYKRLPPTMNSYVKQPILTDFKDFHKNPSFNTPMPPQTLDINTITGIFDFSVLCNDMIGFLSKYYPIYSQVTKCVRSVRKTMKIGSILFVTQPGMLFPCDNIQILRDSGFECISFVSVDTRSADGRVAPRLDKIENEDCKEWMQTWSKCVRLSPTETDAEYKKRVHSYPKRIKKSWNQSKGVEIHTHIPQNLQECPLGFYRILVCIAI